MSPRARAASPRPRRLPGGVGARTDAGLVRQNNEDAWLAAPPLYVVADGMGGRAAGEIASHAAVAELEARARTMRRADTAALREMIAAANARIREAAAADPSMRGMGTTCTVLWLEGRRALVAHVGDSRAYRLRDGLLEQLTTDHTLVDELVAAGRMTAAEASAHVDRSVITRALGAHPDVDVDVVPIDLEPGDRLMLCSDGLTTMVVPDDIRAVLATATDPQRAADDLVELALRGGGEDNVTVVVVDPAAASAAVPGHRGSGRRRLVALVAVVALLVAGAGALALGVVPGLVPAGVPTPPSPPASASMTPRPSPSPSPTRTPAASPSRSTPRPTATPAPTPTAGRRTAPPVAGMAP